MGYKDFVQKEKKLQAWNHEMVNFLKFASLEIRRKAESWIGVLFKEIDERKSYKQDKRKKLPHSHLDMAMKVPPLTLFFFCNIIMKNGIIFQNNVKKKERKKKSQAEITESFVLQVREIKAKRNFPKKRRWNCFLNNFKEMDDWKKRKEVTRIQKKPNQLLGKNQGLKNT